MESWKILLLLYIRFSGMEGSELNRCIKTAGFVNLARVTLEVGFHWGLYGNSIALTIRSFDRSLFVPLIVQPNLQAYAIW